MILLDLDSTLLETFDKQEGEALNFHYRVHGKWCDGGLVQSKAENSCLCGVFWNDFLILRKRRDLLDDGFQVLYIPLCCSVNLIILKI